MSQSSSYYGNVNRDLLNRIPRTVSRLLEIGCGSGSLGSEYKSLNPKCVYVGVEYAPLAAKTAEKYLDVVICGNVESLDLDIPLINKQLYDCLIYGDVLEHLLDPWSVLERHLDLLSDHGTIVACIPNVQHWSVIANLLAGKWPYNERGIFDRTHLRWFTRESVSEWFQSLNLSIYEIYPRIFNIAQARNFTDMILPGLKNLQLDADKVFDGMARIMCNHRGE